MNKLARMVALISLAVALLVPQIVNAEAIVVLKPEQAMFATDKAIALGQQLSAQLKPQTSRLDDMAQELQALRQRLQADKDLLSSAEVEALESQIQILGNEHQQLNNYLANIKGQTEQEFLAKMRPVLDKVLRQLIEANAISLIINGQSTIYHTAAMDITSKVVELLNLEP
jgi:outer membrane protein